MLVPKVASGKPPCSRLNLVCQFKYFELEEYRRERFRLQRLLCPETLKGEVQRPRAYSSLVRLEVLAYLGKNKAYYQELLEKEAQAKRELEELALEHPLWPHWSKIRGLGPYLVGAFAAAAGDISQTSTIPAFWKTMGLDVLPDGTVPRKIRGRRAASRRIPACPHVTTIGEQIRQSILRAQGKLAELYNQEKKRYTAKYPDRPKLFNHKAALRSVQKILYALSWIEMRKADGLPAPLPYAFSILKHPTNHLITFADLYDTPEKTAGKNRKKASQRSRATGTVRSKSQILDVPTS